MSTKSVLAGFVALGVMNIASASSLTSISEKQEHEKIINGLFSGFSVLISHPECTIKGSSETKK